MLNRHRGRDCVLHAWVGMPGRLLSLPWVLVLAAAVPGAAHAQAPPQAPLSVEAEDQLVEREGVLAPAALHDEGCLECHSVGDLRTVDVVTGREYKLALDVPGYLGSSHRALLCRACHRGGYQTVPHRSSRRRDAFACLFCHRDDRALGLADPAHRRAEVERSVHQERMKKRAGGAQPIDFDCHRCHDPHLFRPLEEGADPFARAAWVRGVCDRCHGPEGGLRPFEEARSSLEAHPFWPHLSLHLRAVACTTCHAPPDATHRILPTSEAVRECRGCHSRDPELLRALFDPRPRPPTPVGEAAGPTRLRATESVYVVGSSRSLGLDRASLLGVLAVLVVLALHAARRVRLRPPLPRSLEELADLSGKQRAAMPGVGPYPAWIRVWHTIHGVVFLALLASGLALHYPVGTVASLPFDWAVRLHNVFGLCLVCLWGLFVALNATGRNGRHYRPRRMLLAASWKQARYYAGGYLRGEPFPFRRGPWRKFNPLQQLSYLVVMYGVVPVSALSGTLLFFPELAPTQVAGSAGVWPMALVHLGAGWTLSLFLVLHAYMITTGPTLGFYLHELMAGVEDDDEEEDEPESGPSQGVPPAPPPGASPG